MNRPDPALEPREQDPVILLALTVLGEARNQPYAGKCAVAQVVRNRMNEKGKSVADTVLKPWAFSCWNPMDPNKLFLLEVIRTQADNVKPEGVWEECVQAAEGALGTPREPDPTCGASHYAVAELWGHDDSKRKKPRWFSAQSIADGITQELARIGSHVFGRSRW